MTVLLVGGPMDGARIEVMQGMTYAGQYNQVHFDPDSTMPIFAYVGMDAGAVLDKLVAGYSK